jgi:hypothetical protein
MGIWGERSRDSPWADAGGRASSLEPAELAWILLLPLLIVALPAIVLLAPTIGRVLFPDPGYHFWTPPGGRKAGVQAGYLMFVAAVVLYAVAIVVLARRRIRAAPLARRALVLLAHAAGVAFVLVCWDAQHDVVSLGLSKTYFTRATLVTAAALAGAAYLALLRWSRPAARGRPRVGAALAADAGSMRALCLGVAALATALWLLPAIYTDQVLPPKSYYLGSFFLDESWAVLNQRSPLVDMVAYGALWPYVVALPLRIFGGGFGVFTATMATLTGVAMLAVYDLLRRVVGRPLTALGLYLPVLATSFFVEAWIAGERYAPSTYFGMFPLRYAGPCMLAWLTVRHLERAGSSHRSLRLLFAAAGLVALNNFDFGFSALAATATAVVVSRRTWTRAALRGFAADLALGVALALTLVTVLTLVRAGSLPHLGLLVRYGRVFVDGGFGNLALPRLGLHLVVTATFVVAAGVTAVRVARAEHDRVTAMLAWCAVFGLGASVYYYAYRSHPDVLVSLFSIWSLTLAFLVVAVVQGLAASGRRPGVPALAVLFGFGLAACSLAQAPDARYELRRIAAGRAVSAESIAPGGFRQALVTRRVSERTRPRERVAILSPVGHRVARDAGVVDVTPYTGLGQMPAREQLAETVELLAREGGTKLFVAEPPPPGFDAEMGRLGFALAKRWRIDSWPEPAIFEYRRL